MAAQTCRGCGNHCDAPNEDGDYCMECAFGNAGGLGPAKLAHTLARLRAAREWHDQQNPHLDGLDQHAAYHAGKAAGYDDAIELLSGDESIPLYSESIPLYSETRQARAAGGPYCECDSGPLIDVDHDAGCRRCGFPVRFTIAAPRHEGAGPPHSEEPCDRGAGGC